LFHDGSEGIVVATVPEPAAAALLLLPALIGLRRCRRDLERHAKRSWPPVIS
jgi:hypothetical protein